MMIDDLWKRADRVLKDALDAPAGHREAFVSQATDGDEELEKLVRALLRDGTAAETLVTPGGARRGPLWRALTEGATGDRGVTDGAVVGEYRLLGQIGRGGMSTVYLGEHTEDSSIQVALKVLRADDRTPDMVRRFEQERQILASVDHPAIAHHLGAGVTADGQPYVAMDYIDGLPIDRYCDDNRLSIAERLRLFLDVARAVQYAHRCMVVHRDLKPSNILVTEDRQVKLLDFGIARIVDADLAGEREPLTQDGQRVMTPRYASPEQVRGELVTTASDVYQLGLVLFEILTGRWPYVISGRTFAEQEKTICERPAMAPSAVTRHPGGDPGAADTGTGPIELICHARRTRPDRLWRQLRGDLDTIVLVALRKEPDRRYPSVEALVRDVEAHLDGQPIAARKDSMTYRAGKFVRRNAIALVSAAAILALALALLGLAVERKLEESRRARRDSERADQVATFLEGLFDAEQRTPTTGEGMSARELLDRGSERVVRDLADQPQLQATLQNLLGDMYRKLGLFEQAEAQLSTAIEIRKRLPGPNGLEMAGSLHSMGRLLTATGRFEEAEEHYRKAYGLYRSELGEDSPDIVRLRTDLADLLITQGRLDEAEPLYRQSLQEAGHGTAGADLQRANALAGLSSLHLLQGRYDEVEPLLLEARQIYESASHPDIRSLAGVLDNLGQLAAVHGDYERAEPLLRQALSLLEEALGPAHVDVAMTRVGIGRLLAEQGRFEEAEPLLVRALASLEQAYQGDHPDIGECLNDLALLYWDMGDTDRAEPLLVRALEIAEKTLGENHPDLGVGLNSLGALYRRQGKFVAAEGCYRRSLTIVEGALGSGHPYMAVVLSNLASVLGDLDRPSEAIPLAERAVAINEASLGHDHPDTARSSIALAALYADRGSIDAARELLDQAVPVLVESLGSDHHVVRAALQRLCDTAKLQGDLDAARTACASAVDTGEQRSPTG